MTFLCYDSILSSPVVQQQFLIGITTRRTNRRRGLRPNRHLLELFCEGALVTLPVKATISSLSDFHLVPISALRRMSIQAFYDRSYFSLAFDFIPFYSSYAFDFILFLNKR